MNAFCAEMTLASDLAFNIKVYGNVVQFIEPQVWHAAGDDLTSCCGEGFFSRSQLWMQTLLRCAHSLCMQSHALSFETVHAMST